MIVSFSVANYRSFLAEETLSLVASKRLGTAHPDHAVPIPGTRESVLKTAVIYGANGAGKSNLFRALRYLQSLAVEPREKNTGTGRERFRLSEAGAELPSSFDLQFIAGDRLYRFGIEVDDQRITNEWLLAIERGRERVLYERVTDAAGSVTVELGKPKGAGAKLRALSTVGGPQNQSFLATVHANMEPGDAGEELAGILRWFAGHLALIAPNEPFEPVATLLSDESPFREFASEFLRAASTGVHHLDVIKKEISEEELYALIPRNLLSGALAELKQPRTSIIHAAGGSELLIERGEESHYYRLTVQAAHERNGEFTPIELGEESDGTRRLLNLTPVLHRGKNSENRVFFIDEIDRSMHPLLARRFLEFFLNSCPGGSSQIIVTTHESNLLDLELLRRDEIWFAEKDAEASTRIYSLADFKVRNDLEIRKHYLQGRFGAIPFLGNLDHLAAGEC